jgi:hypothetical protein
MRHFLIEELDPSLAVTRLPGCVQASSARSALILGAGSMHGIAPLLDPATRAEPLPAITSPAEPNLNPATATAEKPVRLRRQEAPSRRFLDLEPEPW